MYHKGSGVPRDYQEALKWFRLAATETLYLDNTREVADAQNNLGAMYFNGEGVTQDYQEAATWFRLAVAQGSERAKETLKRPEMVKAIKMAAIPAQSKARQVQHSTRNRTQTVEDGAAALRMGNHTQAIQIFRSLAAQGDVYAQYNLGVMYDDGKGVTQDHQQAAAWFRLAATRGHESAREALKRPEMIEAEKSGQ